MTSEPGDDVIRTAILATVKRTQDSIRPNKLRKIVCKELKETNWTQFQRVLDSMIKQDSIYTTKGKDGDMTIRLCQEGSRQIRSIPTVDGALQQNTEETTAIMLQVPQVIIFHLIAKGRRKQKNIELNTKTKISFDKSVHEKVEASNFDKQMSVTITKLFSSGPDESAADAKETARKHLKTAKLMITKMLKAYETNPEHFRPKKAGGTLAEQDETKIKKLKAAQKKRKFKKTDDCTKKSGNNRSKTRKFY